MRKCYDVCECEKRRGEGRRGNETIRDKRYVCSFLPEWMMFRLTWEANLSSLSSDSPLSLSSHAAKTVEQVLLLLSF
jgi:hypothetical protein